MILVNLLALFGVSAYFHSQSRNSPARGTRLRVTQAAQMLEQNPEGTVRMSEEGTACLDSSGAEFAFLLNDAGDVIWTGGGLMKFPHISAWERWPPSAGGI